MDNLHRELAPIAQPAWSQIDQEASRTLKRHLAGRRVVDFIDGGPTLSAVGTGHLRELAPPATGIRARARQVAPLVELRVPFTLDREQVDSVERGAADADWQPLKDAARQIAFAEDRIIFHGYADAAIAGIGESSSHEPLTLAADIRQLPDTVSHGLSALKLAGVEGPYSLVLSEALYTAASEGADHGYPVLAHLDRLLGGAIVWGPAVTGAYLLSCRGGDYQLHVGQDFSIGYLGHDAHSVELYLQESLTFLALTSEAAVSLAGSPGAATD